MTDRLPQIKAGAGENRQGVEIKQKIDREKRGNRREMRAGGLGSNNLFI